MSSHSSSSPSSSFKPTIPRIRPGEGRIVVEFDEHRGHTFVELSCTYPLKLLSPKSKEDPVAIAYVLSYGGGLVGGDEVELEVAVREGASLMLLSQVR
jgi:urease accessory protein